MDSVYFPLKCIDLRDWRATWPNSLIGLMELGKKKNFQFIKWYCYFCPHLHKLHHHAKKKNHIGEKANGKC